MQKNMDSEIYEMVSSSSAADGTSSVHRLDPRAKWVVTFLFVLTVTSFGKYDISRLMPLFFYPIAITALSGVPARSVLKRTLLAAPFILMVALFNPLFDRRVLLRLGNLEFSGGWVSFISIVLRSSLAVSSAVLLILTSRFDRLCLGLERMGVPGALVTQLQFLHRYIYLLAGEAQRSVRAHALRCGGNKPKISFLTYGSMTGLLLLKTLDRATRIHQAMQARGFDGEVRVLRPLCFSWRKDGIFVLSWSVFFFIARFFDVPGWIFRTVVGS